MSVSPIHGLVTPLIPHLIAEVLPKVMLRRAREDANGKFISLLLATAGGQTKIWHMR